MRKSYLNSQGNGALIVKPSRAIRLFLMVLFVYMLGNNMSAQVASSTWPLTANANATSSGNVSSTASGIGAGISTPVFTATSGESTSSWSNDSKTLVANEYYEFKVTPNANNIFTVTAINFEHSANNGTWQVQAYYSTDNFATSTAIALAFNSTTTVASNSNSVNLAIDATTLSIRVYGWESDGSSRSLRIRNFVISGTTCAKPLTAGTITGEGLVCKGQAAVTYTVPVITNATGYTWTLPSGATIVAGSNTNSITVDFSSTASSGNLSVKGTNTCANGGVSANYPVTVNSASVGGSITGDATVCSGTNSTTLTLSGYTGSITKWQSSPSSTFTSGVTNISNTNDTYTASNLTVTTYYRALVTSGVCSAANSGNATITVNAAAVGGSIAGSTSVCSGTNATILTISGYTGSINKWQSSPSSTFSSGVTNISNTNVTYTASNLTATTYYRAVITNGICSANSNIVAVTVNTAPSISIQPDTSVQKICLGDSPTILSVTAQAGSGTISTYEWFANPVNSNTAGTTVGTNSSTYTPSTSISGTQYYYCVITNSNGCKLTTNVSGSISVSAPPTTTSVLICTEGSGQLTASATCVGSITNSISGTWNGATDQVALRPDRTINNTSTCPTFNPSDAKTNYVSTAFQVSVTGSYTFTMNSGAAVGIGYITTGNPANCSGWVKGDSGYNNGNTIAVQITATLTKGVAYNLISTIYLGTSTVAQTYSGSFQWAITPPSGGGLILDGGSTIDWYTSGGTKIGTGSPFNPVGILNSNLPDTKTPGTYTYYAECSSNPGCRMAADFVILLTPSKLTGYVNATDCTLIGSVYLSGLPATGTWTLTQSGTATATIRGTGADYTVLGLGIGSYTFTAANESCTSVASNSFFINAPTPNTWNGTSWSLGWPDSTQNIVFNGAYPLASDPDKDIRACSCTVNPGAVVKIKSGHFLVVTNEVIVDPMGSLTFDNNASLVQINDNPITKNSGKITYERETTPVLSSDYTYWSSPVKNETLKGFLPTGTSGRFYSFNAFINNWKYESITAPMLVGTGYIVQIPIVNAPQTYEGTFVGEPNNGELTTEIGPKDSSNLIGNPYPSALDADLFLIKNKDVISGTLAFWTHNTAIQLASGLANAGSGAYAYTSDDYAHYNITGGTAAGVGSASKSANSSGKNMNAPSGKIAAGQGFFATSIAAGTLTFNNKMRLDTKKDIIANTQFFKSSTNSKAEAIPVIEKNRLWLNFTNTQGAFKQVLIGYITGATNDFDNIYDGESANSNAFVDFYSCNQNKNWAIQGRALPFVNNDEVPLGFSSKIAGSFTIEIAQVDGLLTNQSVFLEDRLTQTVFDLKSGNYTFTTASGVFNDRFVLRYTNKTLGTADFTTLKNQVLVSNANRQIQISSSIEGLDKVAIYDIAGKQLYLKTKLDSKELQIANLEANHQVLLIKTSLQNGQEIVKKIIY